MKWRKFFGLKPAPCKHTELVSYQELCKTELSEPGKKTRSALIRMLVFKCTECDRPVRLFPRGIAHDPVSGIFRDESEPDKTEEISVSEDVRKEVLEHRY